MNNFEFLVELKSQRRTNENIQHSFFMKKRKRINWPEKQFSDPKTKILSFQNKFVIKRKIIKKQEQMIQAQKNSLKQKKFATCGNSQKLTASFLINSQRSKTIEKRIRSRRKNLKLNSWDHNRIFPKVKGSPKEEISERVSRKGERAHSTATTTSESKLNILISLSQRKKKQAK